MVGRRFGPIERHERLSDKVAAAIQRSIGDGELVQGDLLPTEMELSTQFEVSRTVIREAIRSLMGRGMLASGPGRRVMVAGADASAARESLSRFIQAATELDYLKVHEVRAAIEVQTAGLAAERAGPDDLAALRDTCDAMAESLHDYDAASAWDLAFHRAIATSTHNDLFLVMLDAISDPLIQIRRMTFGPGGRSGEALASHRDILDQVERRDAGGARAAMREHLTDVAKFWTLLAHTAEPSRWFPAGLQDPAADARRIG
jgi:GntR family transcriptional repressor for pyruvate dehydrogenase complex